MNRFDSNPSHPCRSRMWYALRSCFIFGTSLSQLPERAAILDQTGTNPLASKSDMLLTTRRGCCCACKG